tara:strand:+ start:924 stop:1769 length:846 start_codon:yes stop_codon:yes gene_type:complete
MTTATVWSAGANLSLNTLIAPTESKRVAGLFFKVTTAGTTGSSEPNWPKELGQIAYDTNTTTSSNVQYLAVNALFGSLQPINPSAIIELFVLTLFTNLHGSNAGLPISNSETNIYRFHSGTNANSNSDIIWAGKNYFRMPIIAEGFAYRKGQIPRPKLIVSNAYGTISTILNAVNSNTVSGALNTGNDLTGARLTRIRTQTKFLDANNFPAIGGNPAANPYGTPDPTAEYKREIYLVDRKATENREIVEFELAAPSDLAGVRIPKRQCTRKLFPAIGTFVQ